MSHENTESTAEESSKYVMAPGVKNKADRLQEDQPDPNPPEIAFEPISASYKPRATQKVEKEGVDGILGRIVEPQIEPIARSKWLGFYFGQYNFAIPAEAEIQPDHLKEKEPQRRQEHYDCPLRALRAFVVLFFSAYLMTARVAENKTKPDRRNPRPN